MERAKQAVNDLLHNRGKHDTTVDETVAPAVVKETVNRHKHENVTTAIDREVHQDHYHTTVQPIVDRQVAPESHKHNIVGLEHREHRHNDNDNIERRLEQERAQFQDTTIEGQTKETSSVAPVVVGERIHHHVHETIQPVIERETLQPTVVHTVVPIHEVHHNSAKHHTSSTLPVVTMDEFQKTGGTLEGRAERHDGFEGEPRSVAGTLGKTVAGLTSGHHGTHNHHNSTNGEQAIDSDVDRTRSTNSTGLAGSETKRHNDVAFN